MVGVSFLENFKVIFDYSRNQMILEPRQGAVRCEKEFDLECATLFSVLGGRLCRFGLAWLP